MGKIHSGCFTELLGHFLVDFLVFFWRILKAKTLFLRLFAWKTYLIIKGYKRAKALVPPTPPVKGVDYRIRFGHRVCWLRTSNNQSNHDQHVERALLQE